MDENNQNTINEHIPASRYIIGLYKPMRTYNLYRTRKIVEGSGAVVTLPRKRDMQVLVIKTNTVRVYIVRCKGGFYFREEMIPTLVKHRGLELVANANPEPKVMNIQEMRRWLYE